MPWLRLTQRLVLDGLGGKEEEVGSRSVKRMPTLQWVTFEDLTKGNSSRKGYGLGNLERTSFNLINTRRLYIKSTLANLPKAEVQISLHDYKVLCTDLATRHSRIER